LFPFFMPIKFCQSSFYGLTVLSSIFTVKIISPIRSIVYKVLGRYLPCIKVR
jgi:hypothetical protein